jgi:diamine N-acetyltransferase
MIEFRKVDRDNYKAVLAIKMPESQHFVAPNVFSLAQAYIYQPKARPFAILNDGMIVGFIMFDWDEEERSLCIWRLMIAMEHQGKGYGQEAVRLAINMAKEAGTFDRVWLDYAPGNAVAEHVYSKLGFKPTGEVTDGEIVMEMKL